jgi:hypothetical protein
MLKMGEMYYLVEAQEVKILSFMMLCDEEQNQCNMLWLQ